MGNHIQGAFQHEKTDINSDLHGDQPCAGTGVYAYNAIYEIADRQRNT
jgi:hypothetical protein